MNVSKRTAIAATLGILAACGSNGRTNEAGGATGSLPPAQTDAAVAPARAASAALLADPVAVAWRWATPGEQHRHTGALGVYVFTPPSTATGPSVHLERDDGTIEWTVQLDAAAGDRGALVLDGDRVLVAQHRFTTSGGIVLALDAATGDLSWKVALQALGPVGHSQYSNEIQLAIVTTRLAVFGDEAGGRYIELLDPETGTRVSSTRVSDDPEWTRLASIPWSWPSADRRWYEGPVEIAGAGGRRYRFTNEESPDRARVDRIDGGQVSWTADLRPEGSCGNAALAEIGDRLVVVSYCSISTGAELYTFDVETGAQRHVLPLLGIGPIGHSKYFNEVRVEADGRYAIVFGNEAFGRYIEVVDATTGQRLSNQRFTD